MTSPSSTILIEDDELPLSWRPTDSQVQRRSPRTSLEVLIEPNDAASGSIEPSRKRKRAKGKGRDTLDTCFRKLRKTFDEELGYFDQEVERLQQKFQEIERKLLLQEERYQEELRSKLILQEERHQEELQRELLLQAEQHEVALSQIRTLRCIICYEQPDRWHVRACGHLILI
ncbi:hypothetical protein PEX2_055700 [Penicillium expansum]|uniref:Uncharacterized protein n=1 Tax=Penicillium expansum TaxID=27334 RepID=A0A0A2J443_PENEN|nr:hypothetical protein PEX2_055700 [Penicillium expansum]KGO50099.1 hypothetical protein PEX2_055700 [Penicillium expansum]